MNEIRCVHCGSDSVYRTRIDYWAPDRGVWVEDPAGDEVFCNECGGNEMEIWEALVDAE